MDKEVKKTKVKEKSKQQRSRQGTNKRQPPLSYPLKGPSNGHNHEKQHQMTTTHEQTTRHETRTRPRTTTRDEDQHQPTKTPRTNQDSKERPGPDYITTRGPRQQENQTPPRTTRTRPRTTTTTTRLLYHNHHDDIENVYSFYTVAKRPRSDAFFGQPWQFLSEQSVPKKRGLVRIPSLRSAIPLDDNRCCARSMRKPSGRSHPSR